MTTQTAVKSKSRAQYTPETWTTIRALYESGNFKSCEDLQKHCKKILSKCPSIDSIRKKAVDWDKHDQDENKTEEKKKNFVEHFAALGMDDKRAAELIVEGMNAGGDIGKKIIQDFIEHGCQFDEDLAKKISEFATHLKVRKYYLELFCKLTGAYAPEKLKVVHKDGDLQKKSRYAEMSKEEILRALQEARERRSK